jgi:phage baseplate assembly protein W
VAVPALYRGYSTINGARKRSWVVTDLDLIKIDLWNAFQTRVGERIMRPTFGCRIWNLLLEPMTQDNINAITNEAIRICSEDPRLALVSAVTFVIEKGVRVEMTLNYVGLNVVDTFTQIFEQEQDAADGLS